MDFTLSPELAELRSKIRAFVDARIIPNERAIVEEDHVKKRDTLRALNAIGFKPGSGTPEPMARQIERDMELFQTVIRERHLTFDQ